MESKGIFRDHIAFKKDHPDKIKLHLSTLPENFPAKGTTPLDGTHPGVYSDAIPYAHNSFLQLGPTFDPVKDHSGYLPKKPPPLYMTDELMHLGVATTIDDGHKYWKRLDNGLMQYKDDELLKQMRGILGSILAKAIKGVFSSNVAGFSVPVRFNEPRSFTDRISDIFRMAHVYLKKASTISDPVERIKLCSVNVLSTLLIQLRYSKSFNPLLGETFQAGFSDGTEVFVEQTSHHPPRTHFYVVGAGNSYVSYGFQEIQAKMKPTNGKLTFKNRYRVTFKDGHYIDVMKFPTIKMTGIMAGSRQLSFINYLELKDPKNKLKAVIFFDSADTTKMNKNKDDVEGKIYRYKETTEAKEITSLQDLYDIESEIAHLDGSWNSKVNINGVLYWSMQDSKLLPLIYATNPLPSDVRYREDIIWVRRKNLDYAESWKDSLEIRQREDKKQRKKFNPNDES